MVLSIIRAILGLILVLFVPGFALVLALYPRKEDLETVERIALSSVLSIALTMLMALFLDMGLGIDYTDVNMVIALIIFTVLCIIAWFIQTGGKYTRMELTLDKDVKDLTKETREEKTKPSKKREIKK